MRVERLRERIALELEWVHYPLHPEIPPEGVSLERLFGRASAARLASMRAQLSSAFAAEGLQLSALEHVPNSGLAQELGVWAAGQPGGEAIHVALFRAYFEQGRDLGCLETLVSVAGEVGLDVSAAREALSTRALRARVEADHARALDALVTGVPCFEAAGARVLGAQPLSVLEGLVARARR